MEPLVSAVENEDAAFPRSHAFSEVEPGYDRPRSAYAVAGSVVERTDMESVRAYSEFSGSASPAKLSCRIPDHTLRRPGMTNEHKKGQHEQPKHSQQAQPEKTQPRTGKKPAPKGGRSQEQPLKKIND